MTTMSDRFDIADVRRSLEDPEKTCRLLCLRRVKKQPGGVLVCCPAHDDKNPSCSITRGDNGGLRVRCFSCGFTGDAFGLVAKLYDLNIETDFGRVLSIAAKLGGVQPVSDDEPKRLVKWTDVERYDYLNEEGDFVYRIVRQHSDSGPKKKRFHPYYPSRDRMSLVMGLPSVVRRVLYRMPELIAADPTKLVYFVEGEKDVNTLTKLGLLATCFAGGASSWGAVSELATKVLKDRSVCIIADADDAGRKLAQQIAVTLHGSVDLLRVIEMPEPHNDVSDYLEGGGNVDELWLMVAVLRNWSPVVAEIETTESAVSKTETTEPVWKRHGVRRMSDILQGVYESCKHSEPAPSVSTGNQAIDRIIGGYRPGKVTVLGSQTSWGKSSWGIMGVEESLAVSKRPLLISGEDDEGTYGKRIMARRAQIDAMSLRDEQLPEDELARCLHQAAEAEDVPWFYDGRGKSVETIVKELKELMEAEKYDLVIVDYLQAFSCSVKQQDRRNELTYISRLFYDAIKVGGAAGLVLSQLKRLQSIDAEPTRSDLKESGDIENGAEHIILGWQKTSATGTARYVKVVKNKDGPQWHNAIEAPFDDRTASFRSC